jgi:hypothetical protein
MREERTKVRKEREKLKEIQSRDEEKELNEFLYFVNSETYRNQ